MQKLSPLKIGPVTLESPVILAPMSGVTDSPFRRLVKSYGAGLVVSEMIASREMVRACEKTVKMAEPLKNESPMSVQLAGTDPEIMAEAARMNEARGADLIDINMGCPVKKVVKSQAGSALMRDEALAHDIMQAVCEAVHIPVTVKMRLGWDENSLNAPQLARTAQDLGLQAVTVHARTRQQMYKGNADWSALKAVRETISIPLIGNGDLTSLEDIDQIIELGQVDGVMIGRGAYGRPWFLKQVMTYLETGEILPDPSAEEKCEIVLKHYDAMLAHYGVKTGLRHARKHLGWYCKGLSGAAGFREEIMTLQSPEHVKAKIKALFLTPSSKKVA